MENNNTEIKLTNKFYKIHIKTTKKQDERTLLNTHPYVLTKSALYGLF